MYVKKSYIIYAITSFNFSSDFITQECGVSDS